MVVVVVVVVVGQGCDNPTGRVDSSGHRRRSGTITRGGGSRFGAAALRRVAVGLLGVILERLFQDRVGLLNSVFHGVAPICLLVLAAFFMEDDEESSSLWAGFEKDMARWSGGLLSMKQNARMMMVMIRFTSVFSVWECTRGGTVPVSL